MATLARSQTSLTAASSRQYEVVQRLAFGGMAEVLLARAIGIERFSKPVVIKRILPQFVDKDEFVAMFLDEARLAATLHHPNIVQTYDIGQTDDGYFFTMEYLHGETLALLMKAAAERSPMPLEHVVAIASGIAAGLHYAHERTDPDGAPLGIVHRDVSPPNVIVTYDSGVKLLDFGIAKSSTAEQSTAGDLKGKIAYMSPEQCQARRLDRRSDVFSLGIVLYQMVTTIHPFDCDSDLQTLHRIVTGRFVRPRELRPELPAALETILLRSLARLPADRFQTADEMLKALEDFASKERYDLAPRHLSAYLRSIVGERRDPLTQDSMHGNRSDDVVSQVAEQATMVFGSLMSPRVQPPRVAGASPPPTPGARAASAAEKRIVTAKLPRRPLPLLPTDSMASLDERRDLSSAAAAGVPRWPLADAPLPDTLMGWLAFRRPPTGTGTFAEASSEHLPPDLRPASSFDDDEPLLPRGRRRRLWLAMPVGFALVAGILWPLGPGSDEPRALPSRSAAPATAPSRAAAPASVLAPPASVPAPPPSSSTPSPPPVAFSAWPASEDPRPAESTASPSDPAPSSPTDRSTRPASSSASDPIAGPTGSSRRHRVRDGRARPATLEVAASPSSVQPAPSGAREAAGSQAPVARPRPRRPVDSPLLPRSPAADAPLLSR